MVAVFFAMSFIQLVLVLYVCRRFHVFLASHCASLYPLLPIIIFLDQWFSECGTQTNINSIIWELVIKVTSQTPPQMTESKTLGLVPRNLYLRSPSGNSDEYGSSSNLTVISYNSLSQFQASYLLHGYCVCLPSSPVLLSQLLKSFSFTKTTIY